MSFTVDSYLVKFYVRKINAETIIKGEVPSLFNLKEEVNKLLS
ncbi:hypothetical protein U732_2937 [Clostridium argentinense CDC 2741]|uniref:Uncharacterized protein n=1 Tax=Clostridium argentinense CDC 2741 TaxID=1418104 RepID=A0A0C1U441_9CLOT|nr:hypothetical protein [Clostridium argentinense]KIE47564.1 hypothetical protein U732_2937 [Clostridium argentinense CDC 2741]